MSSLVHPHHRWLIFRHGLATHSTEGYGDQVFSAPLLEEGITAIERLAEYLKGRASDSQYCSEVLRCRQTAAIVSRATGKDFQFDRRLNEYHQETFTELSQRVADFLSEVNQANPTPKTFWICTHGAVIAALRHLIIEGAFTAEQELDYTKPGEILEIHQANIQVHTFND